MRLFLLLLLVSIHFSNENPVNASVQYQCGCTEEHWKQDLNETKSCPYCGAGMPGCGIPKRIFAKPGENYQDEDFLLPNPVCPVSGKQTSPEFYAPFRGGKLLFHSPKDRDSYLKSEKLYFRRIELRRERFEKHLQMQTKDMH